MLHKKYKIAIQEIADKYGVEYNEIYKIYSGTFKAIYDYMSSNEKVVEISLEPLGEFRLVKKWKDKIMKTKMLDDCEKNELINQIQEDFK